jgi:NAD(P)-dependent dehydrogenase (short-subunit alcohol dehydrogenase family)
VDKYTKLFDLSGKVTIVTGSGRGIGRRMAEGLAAFGAQVVVCDVVVDEAERTAEAINAAGGKASATFVDIAMRQSCEELLKFTLRQFGRVDVLVNNAAIDIIKPLDAILESDWDKILDVDLKGHFTCSQLAAAQMIEQGAGGSIINISSIASAVGIHGLIPYSAAKGGINQLTRAMAIELAPCKIRVNAIAPGYVENVMRDADAERAQLEKQQQIITFTPLGRRGKPEELVGPVVFLASDASSYVTGAVLFVDGGYTAA